MPVLQQPLLRVRERLVGDIFKLLYVVIGVKFKILFLIQFKNFTVTLFAQWIFPIHWKIL